MNQNVINKRMMFWLRFVYRFGLIKTLLLFIAMLASAEEYHLRWKGHTINLRKGTTDFNVFCQVLVFEQYRTHTFKIPASPVIVDLGANIGLSVLYYKHKYPGSSVIAVEPDKANFELMRKNVQQLNGVYCINKAVWSHSKMIEMVDSGRGEYGYHVREAGTEATTLVEAISMPDLLRKFELSGINLLKIDIEGTEKELFSAADLSWVDHVDNIIIELHDPIFPGCSVAFFRAICKRYYQLSWKGENLAVSFTPEPADKRDTLKSNDESRSFFYTS